MGGRYASYIPPEAIARLFGTVGPVPRIEPTWNLVPGRDALVVRRIRNSGKGISRPPADGSGYGWAPVWR
jgi:hypothetical protein